ncbi:MAG: hypothetical protein V4636_19510 [Pseudomonadota bacterium]
MRSVVCGGSTGQRSDAACHGDVMPAEYGAVMVPVLNPSTGHRVRGIGCALLWGAFELVALARSRWSARLHAVRARH